MVEMNELYRYSAMVGACPEAPGLSRGMPEARLTKIAPFALSTE